MNATKAASSGFARLSQARFSSALSAGTVRGRIASSAGSGSSTGSASKSSSVWITQPRIEASAKEHSTQNSPPGPRVARISRDQGWSGGKG